MQGTNTRLTLFRAALDEQRLSEALAVLNANVPHRFTAVNRLTDGMLHNFCVWDKLGKINAGLLAPIPLTSSFCQFAFRDGVFQTSNAAIDPRLDGHPFQKVMLSYSGVPITDLAGEVIGSLCHLDLVPQTLTDDEFELLQHAGRFIAPGMLQR